MRLLVATPVAVAVDAEGVTSVRAADASGAFGVLPGHADLLTALRPGVLTWRDAAGEHHCAVRGGVLRVSGGRAVAVATREAVASDDLARLEADVLARYQDAARREAEARVAGERLHLAAVRCLLDRLRVGAPASSGGEGPP